MKHLLVLGSFAVLLVGLAGCASSGQQSSGNPQFTDLGSSPKSGLAATDGKSTDLPARLKPVTLTNLLSSDLLKPVEGLFTLGPGDSLEIEILGNAGSRTTVIVGPDGKIYYNLLPGIDIWGLTIEQARALLERELSK